MASAKSWRSFFHASTTAVFVVGASRRLRYANPAWERVTGADWAKLRGLRLSAFRSATPLGQTLMPPPEVWAGEPCRVRRAPPDATSGPPWWDFTFVPLPGGDGRLLGVVGFLTQHGERTTRRAAGKLPADLAAAQADHARHYGVELLTGTTAVGERFVNLVRLAASTVAPVWLIGERGSGKTTAARVIHHQGPTHAKAFVAADAHGVQPYLLDALLFGKGGAALPTGGIGTLFLHDPGLLPRDFQEKLAGYLSKPAAPRVVCASALSPHADPRLIDGFATRFGVLEVRVPGLRDRPDDLPWFAERVTPHPVADAAWPVLAAHDWPGNLRELSDVLRTAAVRAGALPIAPEHLPRVLRERHLLAANPLPQPRSMALAAVLEAVERRMIEDALLACHGNATAAAKRLDVPRATLLRRVEAFKIPTVGGGGAP